MKAMNEPNLPPISRLVLAAVEAWGPLSLTHEEIGKRLGLHRITVLRHLHALRDRGMVKVTERTPREHLIEACL